MNLRAALSGGAILAAPGVSNPFGALMVEHLGFGAAYLGGNGLGLELGKGQPFLEARDIVEAVARIAARVSIPIIADAGTGFGDPAHVARAVRDIEAAGATALHIDDQLTPKRAHYHRGVTQIAPVAEMVARLERAVAARRSADFMIVARSDALRVRPGVETHLDRLRAYARSGVDGLLVLGSTLDDATVLRREFPGLPIFWIATLAGTLPTLGDLGGAGYAAALYPFHGVGAVTEALLDAWGPLKRDGRPAALRRPAKEIVELGLDLVGMPEAWDIEEATLGPLASEIR